MFGIHRSSVMVSRVRGPLYDVNLIELISNTGFPQKRFMNGSFAHTDPTDCSPKDSNQSRECSLQEDNQVGFYESSSWEYSWSVGLIAELLMYTYHACRFAPHDTAHLIKMMGGNVRLPPRLTFLESQSQI